MWTVHAKSLLRTLFESPIHIDRIELYDAKQDNIDAQKVYKAIYYESLKANERNVCEKCTAPLTLKAV